MKIMLPSWPSGWHFAFSANPQAETKSPNTLNRMFAQTSPISVGVEVLDFTRIQKITHHGISRAHMRTWLRNIAGRYVYIENAYQPWLSFNRIPALAHISRVVRLEILSKNVIRQSRIGACNPPSCCWDNNLRGGDQISPRHNIR